MAKVKAEIQITTASGTHEPGEEFDYPTTTPEQERDLNTLVKGGALTLTSGSSKSSHQTTPKSANTNKSSDRKDPAEELKEG